MNSKPSLLELCARVMYRDTTEDPNWPSSNEGQADIYRSNARAVFEAILTHLSPESRATLERELKG